jgi:pimeloyl-ACP methyl ester carboxylesterase
VSTIRGFLICACLSAFVAAFAASDPDATGDWKGTISARGMNLRIALHLGDIATFDSLDQGARGIPARMTMDGRKVSVAIQQVGNFEGELSADGASLAGVLKQGATVTPVTFERGAFEAARRPQTPRPPFPYRSEEVGYENPQRRGVHLAGTITIPEGKGPFPAVLLITGSGAQDRDETLFDHKPFLVLADHLTRRGIAVLRVDDRGRGGSTGATRMDTSEDYASDVAAGVGFLKSRSDIDARRIGLLGHSEGGLIAPLVASKDPSIAFLVLWAGPGVSGGDVIVEQARVLTLASGATPAAADAAARNQRAIVDANIAAADAEAARTAVVKAMQERGMPSPPESALRAVSSAWYRFYIAYDPVPALRATKAPVLALLGSKDLQVTVEQNLSPLRKALADNSRAEVRVLENLNHLFQTAKTGNVDEYAKIEETMSPIALQAIADWIVKTTAR